VHVPVLGWGAKPQGSEHAEVRNMFGTRSERVPNIGTKCGGVRNHAEPLKVDRSAELIGE
jgi:hypothetical protein